MSKEVKRWSHRTTWEGAQIAATMIALRDDGEYVDWNDYATLLAERDALRNDHGSMRNAIKNARYRIEQGRVWNGMGWTLTGLHAHQQQKALDEIDAALQGEQP